MPVRIDEAAWPLVIVHFEGTPTDEEFAAYLSHCDTVIARGQPYALIIDASRGTMAPFGQRRQQAEWLKRNKRELVTLCRATAFVVTSIAMRAVLSTIFLLAPMPGPQQVFATLEDARAWAQRRLNALP